MVIAVAGVGINILTNRSGAIYCTFALQPVMASISSPTVAVQFIAHLRTSGYVIHHAAGFHRRRGLIAAIAFREIEILIRR